jgi:hypothetical protein
MCRVFTARYALSPYIKQVRLVFKGLIFCHCYISMQQACVPGVLICTAVLKHSVLMHET